MEGFGEGLGGGVDGWDVGLWGAGEAAVILIFGHRSQSRSTESSSFNVAEQTALSEVSVWLNSEVNLLP